MRKIKLFMMLALLVAGVSGAWANPVSFSYSDFTGQGSSQTYTPISASKDGVTVSSDRGYGPSGNNHFRIYAGGKLSITSSKKITSVYVRFSASNYNNLSGDNFSKYSSYSAGSYGIWTGLSNSVELTNNATTQARITYIYVSFEGSVLYTWSSSPEGIEGDLEVISSPISYSFNNTNYESDITGPRDFGGDIGKAISVTNVPSIIVLQNGTPYDFPYYSYNYFYGSASSITYYKFWVKDGLEYSNYHVQSTRNHGFMDDKFDYFSDKPELAVRLYLGETITVSDTVKYEKPLWASPTVNDSRTLPDDDGDGVGTTATYKYLGQLDVNGTYNMNYDYFYLRTHQIAYSTRTSVTIPREVTFDGTTYKVTAIQKWGMDYTKTHIWLSDYCYNMKSDGGGNQDKTNKVTEHQNINDHRNEYLTSITFESPSNVHSIGDYAFMSMYNSETKTGLEYIEIPSSVEYLGTGVFECCLALNDVEFQTYTNDAGVASTHVPEIRDYAFWCCVALEEITLPDGITKIGDCSFQYNFKLSKIELPNTLTTIGDHFLCCASSLQTLTIPYAVTDIAGACFHGFHLPPRH